MAHFTYSYRYEIIKKILCKNTSLSNRYIPKIQDEDETLNSIIF